MSLTLLLDLDDTLLINSMDTFVPAYLNAFAGHVDGFVDPQKFISALLGGTRLMSKNRRPDCTLQAVFEEFFFSALPVDVEQFRQLAARFYAEVFPTLRSLTSPRPGGVALVEQALERGYRLAIATNPLFPLTAIQQRLAWAGLPVEQYPFDLVSSYDTFHFAKPDPAYFAEMLAYLGWPEDGVVMVGDDLGLDISPARQLGLPAFWLTPEGGRPVDGETAPSAQGQLSEVLPWLDGASPQSLQPGFDSPAAMLATLRATPAALSNLCRRLPGAAWAQRPQTGEWSLTEIVCHLRDVDREVNLERLQITLAETNPFIPGRDTDPWAEERQYIRQDGEQALGQFIQARLKLLEILEGMPPQDWQRPVRHAIFGPTQLRELVGITAAHDRLHLRQVIKVIQQTTPQI